MGSGPRTSVRQGPCAPLPPRGEGRGAGPVLGDGPGPGTGRRAGQTRSAAIRTYWKEPSLYDSMNASSMPVTSDDVARSSQ